VVLPFSPFSPFLNGAKDGARDQALEAPSESRFSLAGKTVENGEKRSINGEKTVGTRFVSKLAM
jgi:hypothetical protein